MVGRGPTSVKLSPRVRVWRSCESPGRALYLVLPRASPSLLYATGPFNVRRAWFYARIGGRSPHLGVATGSRSHLGRLPGCPSSFHRCEPWTSTGPSSIERGTAHRIRLSSSCTVSEDPISTGYRSGWG